MRNGRSTFYLVQMRVKDSGAPSRWVTLHRCVTKELAFSSIDDMSRMGTFEYRVTIRGKMVHRCA